MQSTCLNKKFFKITKFFLFSFPYFLFNSLFLYQYFSVLLPVFSVLIHFFFFLLFLSLHIIQDLQVFLEVELQLIVCHPYRLSDATKNVPHTKHIEFLMHNIHDFANCIYQLYIRFGVFLEDK